MRALLLFALAGAVGCSDDPPTIRMLQYTPNAALTGTAASINGMMNYVDQDGDISQSQVNLVSPSGLATLSSPDPIQNVTQGPLGMVSFTISFTPGEPGNWHFDVWIIDLLGRASNKLGGTIRVSDPTGGGGGGGNPGP